MKRTASVASKFWLSMATILLGLFVVQIAFGVDALWGQGEILAYASSFTARDNTVVDYSNSSRGFVVVKTSCTKKAMLSIERDSNKYFYEINNNGRPEQFPLQAGNGKYEIKLYENVKGNQYCYVLNESINVSLDDPTVPFRYASQYVNYNDNTKAVVKAAELCRKSNNDADKVRQIYDYICKNIKYNKQRAKNVANNYLPNIDEVFTSKKGICFDYSALMAAMLRSQGVPTQLVIGYVNKNLYHAWNKVYINGSWVVYDSTFGAGKTKGKSYAEERRY